MSSKLQLDVCHLNRRKRHLVNAYEVKAGMAIFSSGFGFMVWFGKLDAKFKLLALAVAQILNENPKILGSSPS